MGNTYGWEDKRQTLWLGYFNERLFQEKVITKEEYQKMRSMIAMDSLNLEVLYGTMTM